MNLDSYETKSFSLRASHLHSAQNYLAAALKKARAALAQIF
jgi:hypothetical protein